MNGINRGLQLIADWMRLVIAATAKSNAEALMDAIGVARVWLAETVDGTGKVRLSSVALLLGADPWRGSRAAHRALYDKWSGLL